MNYHTDEQIKALVYDHLKDACEHFKDRRVVGIFLQGSQNYGLESASSDVDTKLIITPSFRDIAMNRKPISTTHIRENNEHIDFKDIRLYMQTFRKQNLNFLEILFTPYKVVNPIYEAQWDRLVEAREDIAHYDIHRSIKSMKGVAMEKFHAMEHPYPSKLEILRVHGYDAKQLHHLLRIEEFLERYIKGESYEDCLRPVDTEYLLAVKHSLYNLADARAEANRAMQNIITMENRYISKHPNKINYYVEEFLDDVQYEIMKISVKEDLK